MRPRPQARLRTDDTPNQSSSLARPLTPETPDVTPGQQIPRLGPPTCGRQGQVRCPAPSPSPPAPPAALQVVCVCGRGEGGAPGGDTAFFATLHSGQPPPGSPVPCPFWGYTNLGWRHTTPRCLSLSRGPSPRRVEPLTPGPPLHPGHTNRTAPHPSGIHPPLHLTLGPPLHPGRKIQCLPDSQLPVVLVQLGDVARGALGDKGVQPLAVVGQLGGGDLQGSRGGKEAGWGEVLWGTNASSSVAVVTCGTTRVERE